MISEYLIAFVRVDKCNPPAVSASFELLGHAILGDSFL